MEAQEAISAQFGISCHGFTDAISQAKPYLSKGFSDRLRRPNKAQCAIKHSTSVIDTAFLASLQAELLSAKGSGKGLVKGKGGFVAMPGERNAEESAEDAGTDSGADSGPSTNAGTGSAQQAASSDGEGTPFPAAQVPPPPPESSHKAKFAKAKPADEKLAKHKNTKIVEAKLAEDTPAEDKFTEAKPAEEKLRTCVQYGSQAKWFRPRRDAEFNVLLDALCEKMGGRQRGYRFVDRLELCSTPRHSRINSGLV